MFGRIGDYMDIVFNSQEELYKRVKPALLSKQKEIQRFNNTNLEIDEIWRILIEKKWKEANDLTLSDIVNDIMNASYEELINKEEV